MYRLMVILALVVATATMPVVAEGGEQGDLEVGLFAGYGFPDSYGDGMTRLSPDDDLLYGLRFGYFLSPRWSLELAGQQFSSETRFDPILSIPDVDFDISSIRLNVLHNFRAEEKLRPFVTVGVGLENTDAGAALDRNDRGYNVGGGARWFVTDNLGMRVDGRYVSTDLGPLNDQKNFETSVGALWVFGPGAPSGDADGDGIRDRRDKCPDTPRGARVDATGCPLDADGDGVADGLDKCADTPVGVPVDASGCPKDSDGDGVHDGIDKCSGTPRGARVDTRGCPIDADQDGVADGLDKCPDTPKGAKVDKAGCPLDSDKDGVYDGLDKCPDTPKGAKVDKAGCPLDSDKDGVYDGLDKCQGTPPGTQVDSRGCKLLFENDRRSLVLEGVNFEFNSARLTPQAEAILDRVALSLKEWSEIRVEVAGHTDSVGAEDYNLRLSTRRAEAVRDYLARRGVDAMRMKAVGYGESRPIADQTTKEGRRTNRRVELKKLN